MSVREQQVNDALRVLDEMHRLCRIERDDYRQRRRRLLESLSDATVRAGRDTVRHTVPGGDTRATGATLRRRNANKSQAAKLRGRRSGARRIAMCTLALGVLACAAAWYWFAMGA